MSSADQQLFINAIHQQLDDAITYNLYTGIAYGMLLAVYCISIRILLSKGSLLHSPGHMFLFGITTIIFILATTIISVGTGLTSVGIPIIIKMIVPSFAIGWSPQKIDFVVDVIAVITRLNPTLSDVVCAWRAMVLWNWDRRVVTVLSICVLGTFGACIYDVSMAIAVRPGTQGEEGLQQGPLAAIIVGPILGTNVLSTSLIAWKAWEYRRTVGVLREGSPSERVGNVLGLLIESGFVYCLLWTFYLLSAYSVLPGAGTYLVNMIMLYVSSMYPAIVIIIVCMQIGQEVYITRHERSNELDLTVIDITAMEDSVGTSLPTTSFSGKPSIMSSEP